MPENIRDNKGKFVKGHDIPKKWLDSSSLKLKGRPASSGCFKKGRKAHLGFKHSEKTIEIISKKAIGRKAWWIKKGVPHPSIGHKCIHSEKTKLKMSLAHKGKHHSYKTEFKKGQSYNKGILFIKNCIICNSEFYVIPALIRINCCSRKCSNISKKGKPLWNKGKKGYHTKAKGRKISEEWRKKLQKPRLSMRGENHYLWKGGQKKIRKQLMGQHAYLNWRREVFKRDNYTCQICGKRGVYLEADHIKPWATNPDLRYDLNNGRTLCNPCHRNTETWGAKIWKISQS